MQVSGQGHPEGRRPMVGRVEEHPAARPASSLDFVQFDGATRSKARFADTDTADQGQGRDRQGAEPDAANPSWIVALNLERARPPGWPARLPMYLGLDLRGGVHFLMQVDMKAALTKKAESFTGDMRSLLRDKNIRHAGITREGGDGGGALPRPATLSPAPRCWPTSCRPGWWTESPTARPQAHGWRHAQAAGRSRRRTGAEAEHHHAAQPRQRTGRGRAR